MQKVRALDRLHQRAALLNAMRGFFAERGVMEVQPPCLGPAAMDPELTSVAAQVTDAEGRPLYLHTSPESAMKQLIAAGSGDIFYLGPAWRGGERGRWHSIEFTLLEWYRIGYDHYALMHELAELVDYCRRAVSEAAGGALPQPQDANREGYSRAAGYATEYLTYQQAFLDYAGVDPLTTSREQLLVAVQSSGIDLHEDPHNPSSSALSRDQLLDLLLSHTISLHLGNAGLTFLTGFPASQAALARLDDSDPRTAQRFELFMEGLEIANGYHELTDAVTQRRRFAQERELRRVTGLPVHNPDERLLAALESGLPPCAGVALGVDRLLAILVGGQSLTEISSF